MRHQVFLLLSLSLFSSVAYSMNIGKETIVAALGQYGKTMKELFPDRFNSKVFDKRVEIIKTTHLTERDIKKIIEEMKSYPYLVRVGDTYLLMESPYEKNKSDC